MGNQQASAGGSDNFDEFKESSRRNYRKSIVSAHTPALEKLFQKLELTAESDNGHPGEITRLTFENVFHGPLHLFGKMLYRQMVVSGHSHHGNEKVKDRISCEQFVKAGKEVLRLFDEPAQHKYYFRLFSEGKDYLTREGALVMVNVAYALTLSSSMIPYSKIAVDDKVFEAVVESMFGMKEGITFQEMEKWFATHCSHLLAGVHNWVYTILTGSKMPSELESAPVPQLEKFIEGKYCISMGILWLLSASLPYLYTHEKESDVQESSSSTKNPFLTSFQFLMKLARLCRCQSWTLLYDSDEHGLSMNSYILAASAPIHALLGFLLPVLCTIFFPVLMSCGYQLSYRDLAYHTQNELIEIQDQTAWCLQYDLGLHSGGQTHWTVQGLHAERCTSKIVHSQKYGFTHHVTSYMEPNITLVSFEGRNIYCIAQDKPWRDGTQRFGGDDTVLLQISPVYRVVQAGGPMVLWNISDRNYPTGIHVGKDGKSIVLHIPADFDSVKHYGVTCELHKVEMWGCGGQQAYQHQLKQKQWEHKEVEKAKSRKLHMDINWDENPDKQLLSWGGIEVNHQYSRNGGM